MLKVSLLISCCLICYFLFKFAGKTNYEHEMERLKTKIKEMELVVANANTEKKGKKFHGKIDILYKFD